LIEYYEMRATDINDLAEEDNDDLNKDDDMDDDLFAGLERHKTY
jgi:hypothetical protein